MSIGATLVLACALLTVFGTADALWIRCGTSRGRVMGLLALLLAGMIFPAFEAWGVRWSPGAVVSVGVCASLAGSRMRPRAAVVAVAVGLVTGSLLFAGVRLIPGWLEQLPVPQGEYLGMWAGLVTALVLRNVRGAAVASLVAALASDLALSFRAWAAGEEKLLVGHNGLMDEAVTALVVAVVIAFAMEAAWQGVTVWWRRRQAK